MSKNGLRASPFTELTGLHQSNKRDPPNRRRYDPLMQTYRTCFRDALLCSDTLLFRTFEKDWKSDNEARECITARNRANRILLPPRQPKLVGIDCNGFQALRIALSSCVLRHELLFMLLLKTRTADSGH